LPQDWVTAIYQTSTAPSNAGPDAIQAFTGKSMAGYDDHDMPPSSERSNVKKVYRERYDHF
jgi:hypothetical protein